MTEKKLFFAFIVHFSASPSSSAKSDDKRFLNDLVSKTCKAGEIMFINRTVATAPNGDVPVPQKIKAKTPPSAPYKIFPAIENGTVPGQ